MADLYLDNQPGASFRAELNQIIEALATNNGGTVEPVPAFPSMWFADWTANMLRRRRKDNTAWLDVSPIDEALLKASAADIAAGVEATKAITSAGLKTVTSTRHDCRFDYVSPTVCRLSRYGGRLITIDGVLREIPVAGVDLAFSGAWGPVNGVGYVYAAMTADVMTLVLSTSVPATDPRDGNRVSSTNAATTLVGAIVMGLGSFIQDASSIGVLSVWNRLGFGASASYTGVATGATAPAPIAGPLQCLVLGDETVTIVNSGSASNNTAGGACVTDIQRDGATMGAGTTGFSAGANHGIPTTQGVAIRDSVGFHRFSTTGYVNVGVGTWTGRLTLSTRG